MLLCGWCTRVVSDGFMITWSWSLVIPCLLVKNKISDSGFTHVMICISWSFKSKTCCSCHLFDWQQAICSQQATAPPVVTSKVEGLLGPIHPLQQTGRSTRREVLVLQSANGVLNTSPIPVRYIYLDPFMFLFYI